MSTAITVFRGEAAGTVNLSGTTSSSRVQVFLTTPGVTSEPVIRLYNAGTVAIFVEFGGSSVTAATTTGIPIAPGSVEAFRVDNSQTYVAGITASGTATLYATPGYGA